ncbi:MAG: SDR family oxidoreductase [Candidatus Sericytochromatia bacterium]|nr:SDR family oxidoreductase [Candidatus Tanganyikabacteria bacterium]
MRFEGKVAIVTGASRGIGRALAVALGKEGAAVVVASKTDQPDPRLPGTIGETAREIEEAGGRALACKVDVRLEAQVQAMIAKAVDRFGRLDILINNAGALFLADVEQTPLKRFDLVMNVNARAAFLCSQIVIPFMRKRGGHILMMSPPLSTEPQPGKAAYFVSKFGMTLIAQSLAAELRTYRIAVNALWPVTAVESQAVKAFGLGTERQWRKADVMVDATLAILARDPATCTGNAYLDEDVLREEGVTDFSGYALVPGETPPPLAAFFMK